MWNGTSFPLVSITNMLKQMKHFSCMSKQIDESCWENPRQLENQPSPKKSALLKKIWNDQKSVPTIPKHLGNLWFQIFISQQNLGKQGLQISLMSGVSLTSASQILESFWNIWSQVSDFPAGGPGMYTLLWGIHEVAVRSADQENSNPWWRSSSKLWS